MLSLSNAKSTACFDFKDSGLGGRAKFRTRVYDTGSVTAVRYVLDAEFAVRR